MRLRNKALVKAEQDRLGKLQLNAMLDKSTTMLQAQKVEMAADLSSEEEGDDSEEDSLGEGSQEEEEEEEGEEEAEEEVATPEPITNGRRRRLVRTISAKESSPSSTPIDLEEPADDDVVFEAPEDDARAGEDQAMEDEMEAEEDDDDDSELGGLADDADIPIEELMRRNGYGAPLGEVDDDAVMDTVVDASSASVSVVEEAAPTVEEVEAEAMSEFGSGSDGDRDGEDDQFDEDMDGNDDGAVSDDSEMDGLAEDADLPIEELMRKYGRAPETNGVHVNGDDSSSVAAEEEAADEDVVEEEVEQEAEEEVEEIEESAVAVPERVNLRPPFLLRGSLRPYQQAGLEWLAGLYSTGVNGCVLSSISRPPTDTISPVSSPTRWDSERPSRPSPSWPTSPATRGSGVLTSSSSRPASCLTGRWSSRSSSPDSRSSPTTDRRRSARRSDEGGTRRTRSTSASLRTNSSSPTNTCSVASLGTT